MFVRVAARCGVALRRRRTGPERWTTHVTGMSDMPVPEPVPEPEPLDPVMVTFSLSDDADEGDFLIADKDDDEATAMAGR